MERLPAAPLFVGLAWLTSPRASSTLPASVAAAGSENLLAEATGAGKYALDVAKELTKAEQAAHAMSAAQASGIGSSAAGAVKGARAATRVGRTARKYRPLKRVDVPGRVDEEALVRLNQAREQADWAAAEAYVALEAHWDHEGDDRLARIRRHRRGLDRDGRRPRRTAWRRARTCGALKAGQRLIPEEWADSLNDPAKSAGWIKEVAAQLSSA